MNDEHGRNPVSTTRDGDAEFLTRDIDDGGMREVLGHFATGVVIVTSSAPEGLLGFTCQSFSSLSLDPPLISVAPARTSSTWPAIRQVGSFCINVLTEDQTALSIRFARSGSDKFDGVTHRPGPGGMPLIDGACAWVACTLEHEYDGGDHTIAVGRVQALGGDLGRRPLLFISGGTGRCVALRCSD